MDDLVSEFDERPGKSASAFRTISEVADELDLAQHVLRFWESKFPQVKPLKRGGGRRYYRPEDVVTLKEIQALLYAEGYTIKGAQKLLRQKRSPTAKGVSEIKQPKAPIIADMPHAEPEKNKQAISPNNEIDLARLRDELRQMRAQLNDVIIAND